MVVMVNTLRQLTSYKAKEMLALDNILVKTLFPNPVLRDTQTVHIFVHSQPVKNTPGLGVLGARREQKCALGGIPNNWVGNTGLMYRYWPIFVKYIYIGISPMCQSWPIWCIRYVACSVFKDGGTRAKDTTTILN